MARCSRWNSPRFIPCLPTGTIPQSEAKVNLYSTVRYDTNSYSVPIQFCGKQVAIKALPERIEIFHSGNMIAVHQRNFGHQESIYKLEHYLPLLERKGRAIFQARPVRDNVPDYFLEWLKRKNFRPKELVALLKLSLEVGYDAAMRDATQVDAAPEPVIQDVVHVTTVDLTAYDALCGKRREVSA